MQTRPDRLGRICTCAPPAWPGQSRECTHMKMIIAIIRPEKFLEVQDALDAKQVHLMTASDVRGCGSQRGYTESFRGTKGVIRLLSKVKLEIAVNEDYVKPAIEAIMKAGHTGHIGAGKIVALPLDECCRIRTAE